MMPASRAAKLWVAMLLAVGAGCGSDDVPAETMPCAFPNIGCFTGELCRSSRVNPFCEAGKWKCPAGSTATDHCPGDASPPNIADAADAADAEVGAGGDAGAQDAATIDAP